MVGVSCALYLQRAGHRVTLVDAHAPGSQTSFGNAATFASYACIPVNHPKLLKNLPALMTGAERPLSISPLYGLRMLPWLFQFLRHCSRERVDQTISGLGALLRSSEAAVLRFSNKVHVYFVHVRTHVLSWSDGYYVHVHRYYEVCTCTYVHMYDHGTTRV